jgi:hypothetical protein
MSGKNIYLGLLFGTFSLLTCILVADPVKVVVELAVQIGNTTGTSTIIINSETFTQLTLGNEPLGVAVMLSRTEQGNERFETVPTFNGQPLLRGFHTGKRMSFGEGCTINGYRFQKKLDLEFLSVKRLP